MAYCITFDNILLEVNFLYLLIGNYGIELKMIIFPGLFDMVIAGGEISPVEIELSLAIILYICGYFGTDWLYMTLNELFGIS